METPFFVQDPAIGKPILQMIPLDIWLLIVGVVIERGDLATLFNLSCASRFFERLVNIPMFFKQTASQRLRALVARLISLIPREDIQDCFQMKFKEYADWKDPGIEFRDGKTLVTLSDALKARFPDCPAERPVGCPVEWASMYFFAGAVSRHGLRVPESFNSTFQQLILYVGIFAKIPDFTKCALENGVATQRQPDLPGPLEASVLSEDIEQVEVVLRLFRLLALPLQYPKLLLIKETSFELFDLLVRGGVFWFQRESDFLYIVQNCSFKYIRPYLESGINVNCKSSGHHLTALHVAAQRGEVETASQLLIRGALCHVYDREHRSPLHLASEQGHTEVTNILLQGGNGKLYITDTTPIHLAAMNGHNATLELLMRVSVPQQRQISDKLDSIRGTALHHAACNGHSDAVAILLLQGCNPARPNASGDTPIHLAAANGHLRVLRKLFNLQYPGELSNAKCLKWETSLHRAIRQGHKDVARFLLSQDGNINAQDRKGRTPLHHVASWGVHWEIAWLFEIGCDINAMDSNGQTTLHYAVREGRWLLMRELLASGADEHVADVCGLTPRELARNLCTPRYNRLKMFDQIRESVVQTGSRGFNSRSHMEERHAA